MTLMPPAVDEPRTASEAWLDANRTVLQAALARVRSRLERHADRTPSTPTLSTPALDAAGARSREATALGLLEDIFGLSPFEVDLLVLTAGVELDGSFPGLCAAVGDPAHAEPTFGLALAVLDDPHWSALAPDGPLRRWSLLTVGGHSSGSVTYAGPLTRLPLRVDERILHFLVGLDTADPRLSGVVTEEPERRGPLPPGQESAAGALRAAWVAGQRVIHVAGRPAAAADVAARAAATLGAPGRVMWAGDVPSEPAPRAELAMLLTRDALLGGGPLLVRQDDDHAAPDRWLVSVGGRVAVIDGPRPELSEPVLSVEVPELTRDEQRNLWRQLSGSDVDSEIVTATDGAEPGRHEPLDGAGDDVPGMLAAQFHFGVRDIESAHGESTARGVPLWDAARHQSRRGLDGLAQRIDSAATWDDLVLPPDCAATLHDVAAHVRHRHTVHGVWGMSPPGGVRGGGVSAMFAGASGTGKTMASEVIANDLGLDLWKVDLSQIVSKYIGETEKNLSRVFDAADRGGCVLLLDEADALFGKRSETKDAHDRYANIEVAHLLQRMDGFRGLAILTTNLRDNIDPAFMRRLQFVLPFPFPDAPERERIWARMFPATVPTEGLRPSALARLVVSGGVIRNIAVAATYLAAAESGPVTMERLLRAARQECTKLERPLAASEVGDWA